MTDITGNRTEVQSLDERIKPFLTSYCGWDDWTLETQPTDDIRFLGVMLFGDDIKDADLQRFAYMIDHLVHSGTIQRRRLAPVIALPLADLHKCPPSTGSERVRRWALMLYTFSELSKDQLNEFLGRPMFFDEGGLPIPGWPEVVLDTYPIIQSHAEFEQAEKIMDCITQEDEPATDEKMKEYIANMKSRDLGSVLPDEPNHTLEKAAGEYCLDMTGKIDPEKFEKFKRLWKEAAEEMKREAPDGYVFPKAPTTTQAAPEDIANHTLEKAKLEDGDLLLIRVPEHVRVEMLRGFRKQIAAIVERLGVNAQVLVVAGDVTLEVVKESQLLDVKALEERIERIEKEAIFVPQGEVMVMPEKLYELMREESIKTLEQPGLGPVIKVVEPVITEAGQFNRLMTGEDPREVLPEQITKPESPGVYIPRIPLHVSDSKPIQTCGHDVPVIGCTGGCDTCSDCGQSGDHSGGEYPCKTCGRNVLHG